MPANAAIRLPKRPSLAVLAVLGVFAIVFSYIFTLAIAVLCVVLPFLAVSHGVGGVQAVALLLIGLVMGATIAWSLVPRRDRFQTPGVLLPLSQHPRLQAHLSEVAHALGQELPGELYLIPDANAWVREHGGVLGFGSRRVMALGLPLLTSLSVSQLRAVLAHEFSHFYSGDTRLGPVVYAARTAMIRALKNLSSDSGAWNVLRRFGIAALAHQLVIAGLTGYWKLFMRLTQLISRQQEFRCDELACHVAGKEAMREGLQKVEVASVAVHHFWLTVMSPALAGGYRPSFSNGFARFLIAPDIEAAHTRYLQAMLSQSKTDAYDTHPALRDRIQRIGSLQVQAQASEDNAPATELLDDLASLETKLLKFVAPDLQTETLKVMDWETAASAVYRPMWEGIVSQYAHLLTGTTVESLPDLLHNLSPVASKIRDPQGTLLTREQRAERAFQLVWMAFALVLLHHGWSLHAQPGSVYLWKGSEQLRPADLLGKLRSGAMTRIEWTQWCAREEIGSASLNSAVLPVTKNGD